MGGDENLMEISMDIVDDPVVTEGETATSLSPRSKSGFHPPAIQPQSDNEPNKPNERRSLPSERTLVGGIALSPKRKSDSKKRHHDSKKRPLHPDSPSNSNNGPRNPESNDSDWRQCLYSPRAGTSMPGASLIEGLEEKGLISPTATTELQIYNNYELESFTFLQEIIPNLFLGSLLALDPAALQEAGITRVLSVMTSNPLKNEKTFLQGKVSREYIMMKDLETFQSHPWYQTTSAIIDSALHAGERILIHWFSPTNLLSWLMSSRMGISRSATVVAAYLTFRHGLTPLQAIAWIRMQRLIVNPNSGFQEQLSDYYSVLQMDHGEDFGWKGLSMCQYIQVDEEREQKKRQKRQYMENMRRKWKNENVEWVNCFVVGWSEDIERIVQKHITGAIA